MKTIKYRAWDKQYKIMREWDWLLDKQCSVLNSKHFIPMLFTGLKDRNKKEIYDGDILENEFDDRYEVKWDSERAMWDISRDEDFYLRFYPEWKIIGNIYENKNLFKEKK